MLFYKADEESRLLLHDGRASYKSMDAENGDILGAFHGPEDLREVVYGTFYKAAIRTGCFGPFAQANAPRWRKVLSALPFLVVLVILAVRAIYFSIQMGSMPPLSMDWGFSVLLFFSSLHGFISFAELRKLICKTKFFDTYLSHLYTVTRHRMPTLTVKSRILPTVFLVFCIYSTVFYCVNKTLQLVATLTDGNSTVPHEGIDQVMAYSFDALNVLTMLMSAYFSAVALTLYILSFTTACSEYNEFHEEVSKAIENSDINVANTARAIVDRVRLLDYYSIQPILFHVIFVAQFVLIVIMVGLKAYK